MFLTEDNSKEIPKNPLILNSMKFKKEDDIESPALLDETNNYTHR